MGDDKDVVEDARTSVRTKGGKRSENRDLTDRDENLIKELMAYGHASTLRGCVLKVEVETTIAMQRQIRTHWVGNKQIWPDVNFDFDETDFLGFNDQSGKYARYEPTFYVPTLEMTRVEVDGFKPMKPEYQSATEDQYNAMVQLMAFSYRRDWESYVSLNEMGVSREITRLLLPGGIYVAGRITANLNGWLGLISKRIDHPDNVMVTKPQAEFQDIAEQVEAIIQERWPKVHEIWSKNGRTRM